MINYFQLYDIPESFLPDATTVKSRFYALSRQYHPDKFARADDDERKQALQMSASVNHAYKTLRDTDATMAHILKLHGLLEDEEKYALPPAFLMEMMDINEAVSDFESDPTNTDARNMATDSLNEQMELWNDATQVLTARFAAGNQTRELLLQIKDQYFRKKYLLRILERMDTFAH